MDLLLGNWMERMDELSSGESQSPPPPTRPTFSSFHVEKSFGKFSTSMQFFREEKWQKPENWKLMSSREFPPKLPRLKHPHRPGLSSEFSLFAMLVSENSNWKFSFAASHRRSTRLVGREALPSTATLPRPVLLSSFTSFARVEKQAAAENFQFSNLPNFWLLWSRRTFWCCTLPSTRRRRRIEAPSRGFSAMLQSCGNGKSLHCNETRDDVAW